MSDKSQSDNDKVMPRAVIAGERPTHSQSADMQISSGNWLLWTTFLLALIWWGAACLLAYSLIGEDLQTISVITLGSLAALIASPGIAIILLGIVGRQILRSRGTYALMGEAASRLLTPAKTATNEITRLADATRTSARAIDQTTSDALASMKALHEALSAERLRAESVTYAMADNARELTERLAEERKSLETLTKAMDAQANMMRDIIPQQSAAMVEAAKTAAADVSAADTALEMRLNQLKQAGSTLAVRLNDLDAIAKGAAERTDGLVQSITEIEDRLNRSDQTIERATESSTIAVEAAKSVGIALQDAVSSALDGAREANEEIAQISKQLQEDTAQSLHQLRLARLDALGTAEEPAPSADEAKYKRPRLAPEPPAPQAEINGHDQAPSPPPQTPLPPPTAPTATDGDLFDGYERAPSADTSWLIEPVINPNTEFTDRPPHIHTQSTHEFEDTAREAGWSDIISHLDEEDSAANSEELTEMTRQDIAVEFMDRLQGSGIALPTLFPPKDKKKIAAASRKSANSRHTATQNAAAEEVRRVEKKLRKDRSLAALAEAFIDFEQAEALQALAETSSTPRPASPRLATFLLTDAAMANLQV